MTHLTSTKREDSPTNYPQSAASTTPIAVTTSNTALDLSGLVLPATTTQSPDLDNTKTFSCSAPPNEEAPTAEVLPPSRQKETLFQPRLVVEALKESSAILARPTNKLLYSISLSPRAKTLLVTTSGIGIASLAYASPAHTLGALGGLLCFASMGLEKNHHSRAQGIIIGALLTGHFIALGVTPSALCAAVATTRTLFQAMLPEDRSKSRTIVAALGFGATASTYGCFVEMLPLCKLNNIPLLGTALGSVAGAFNQKYSWATRACFLAGTTISIPYHIFESQSLAGVAINAILLPRILRSIWRYDIAKTHKPSGQLMTE